MAKYIEVGKLNKTFGTKGQIKVAPSERYQADLERCDVWFIDSGAGEVPYFVEDINQSAHFLVRFEDIDSPEKARKITGNTIKLRASDVTAVKEVPGDDDLQFLSGFKIFDDKDAFVGVISRIEEYPQQLMAMVDTGDSEVMVPLVEAYITEVDTDSSTIFMILPEGLIDTPL